MGFSYVSGEVQVIRSKFKSQVHGMKTECL